MKSWFSNPQCRHYTACIDCRTFPQFRNDLFLRGAVHERDFKCPEGITKLTASTVQRDALIALATTAGQLQAIAKGDMQKRGCCRQPIEVEI